MDANGQRLLCIIVPCYDEEQAVEHTHAELKRVLGSLPRWRHLVYFVDDGSRDGTLERLHALSRFDDAVRVISLSRNFGHQAAITAGLDHADRRADAVLVMDADLENPPAIIPAMLAALDRGHDVAMGVRETGRVVGWWNRFASRSFYWLFNRLSDIPITPGAPDFFVLSRRAREALARMGEQRRFLRGMVAWIGFSRAHIPYVPPARVGGRSKYDFGRMLRLAADAVFAFSSAPLRLVTWAGTLTAAAGATLLCISAARWFLGSSVGAPFWMAGLMTWFAGLQLLGLGLVGGYVARSFQQSQGRPLYVVREVTDEHGSEARVLDVNARSSRRASRST